MKKIMWMMLCLLLVVGCAKKEDTYKKKMDEMKEKLLEYGKYIYDNDYWMKGGHEEGVYYMTLTELHEKNGFDITMFKNPKTGTPCDPDATRVEFYVLESHFEDVTNYHFDTYLKCDE